MKKKLTGKKTYKRKWKDGRVTQGISGNMRERRLEKCEGRRKRKGKNKTKNTGEVESRGEVRDRENVEGKTKG